MGIKVDFRNFKLDKLIDTAVRTTRNKTRTKFFKQAAEQLKKDLVETVQSGNSPVKGQRRYKGYSTAYRDAIRKGTYSRYNKRQRPVNLTLSGRMLKQIAISVTPFGFILRFTNKLAKIHNEYGASKKKIIRRIYPKATEEFKESVTLKARKILSEGIRKTFTNSLRRK